MTYYLVKGEEVNKYGVSITRKYLFEHLIEAYRAAKELHATDVKVLEVPHFKSYDEWKDYEKSNRQIK